MSTQFGFEVLQPEIPLFAAGKVGLVCTDLFGQNL